MEYPLGVDRLDAVDLIIALRKHGAIDLDEAAAMLPDDISVHQLIRAREAGIVSIHALREALPDALRVHLKD